MKKGECKGICNLCETLIITIICCFFIELSTCCAAGNVISVIPGESVLLQADSCKYNGLGITGINYWGHNSSDVGDASRPNYFSRFFDNIRLLTRIPVKNVYSIFSYFRLILQSSERENSLSKILIKEYSLSINLVSPPSCRYYVFTLREILI
jgi:hypothetical protein